MPAVGLGKHPAGGGRIRVHLPTPDVAVVEGGRSLTPGWHYARGGGGGLERHTIEVAAKGTVFDIWMTLRGREGVKLCNFVHGRSPSTRGGGRGS